MSNPTKSPQPFEPEFYEYKQKYLDLMESSADAIISIDQSGNFTSFSKAAELASGYRANEVIGKSFAELNLLTPESLAIAQLNFVKLFRGEIVKPIELSIITKDNRTIILEANPYVTKRDNQISGIQIVFRDMSERKVSEVAVRISEANYRSIFDAANDAIFVLDLKTWTIIDFNIRMQEMFGYAPAEKSFMNLSKLMPDMPPYNIKEALEWLDKDPLSQHQLYEWLAQDKNGRRFWIEISFKKETLGGQERLLAVIREIDQRKRMEQLQLALYKISDAANMTDNLEHLLKTIHIILSALINTNNFYVALYDEKKDIYSFPYHVDPEGKDDFHPRPLKKRITDYVRRTGRPILAKDTAFAQLQKSGEIEIGDFEYPKVWLGLPLKTAKGVLGVFAVQSYDNDNLYSENDLSLLSFVSGHIAMSIERKQADEALRESEEKYRSLIEALPDGLGIIDLDRNIIFVNPAACDIWGYSYEEIIGMNVNQLTSQNEFNEIDAHNLKKIKYEATITKKDGQSRTIFISAAPLFDNQRNVMATVAIFRDITEITKIEKEKQELKDKLSRAQRMESLGMLAGGVAHDLNNILGPLVAYPEIIRMKLPPDSPALDRIAKMEASAQRAAEVVQDLLTMARRGRYEMSPVSLNEVIQAFLNSSEYLELRQKFPFVEADIQLNSNLPMVYGSETHLTKIIMNLIINSFDSMANRGQLTITTEARHVDKLVNGYDNIDAGMFVILTVRDTGIGIDTKDIKRIFEPFYTKKQLGRSGSGLGLSIVYGVVKDHNGYIDVKSEINNGSEFIVYLPVYEYAANEQQKKVLDIRGNEHVLVIDDMAEQRELAGVILNSLGYKAQIAASGLEAINYVRNNPVDIIVLDMIMENGLDGLDTYKKIIEIYPNQKAIITSGYSETDRVKEAEKLGVKKYIRKPYTLQKIGKAIREVLDN